MSLATNPFSAEGVKYASESIGASSMLLQTYTSALVAQPTVSIETVPGMVGDQALAISNSIGVQTEVVPSMTGLLAHVLAFSNLFSSELDRLATLAIVLDDARTSDSDWASAAAEFTTGLTNLRTASSSGQASRNGVSRDLALFESLAQTDATNLDADLKVAQATLDAGTIASLQSELAAVIAALDADNKKIASGATKGLVSAAEVALGVVVSYYKGPKDGFEIIVAGIQGAVDESQAEKAAIDDVSTQFTQYNKLMTELLADEAIFSVVSTVTSMQDLLLSHLASAQQSITSISDSWNGLTQGLTDLAGELAGPKTATLNLADNLKEATNEWTDLHSQVVDLQSSSPLPTVKTNVGVS